MEFTTLLQEWRAGDEGASEEIVPLVYGELHRIAAALMSQEGRGHTLQPTALINELFLRLVKSEQKDWNNRAHFLAVAARGMRQVLVDHARRNLREKRGGARIHVELSEAMAAEILALDETIEWDEFLAQLEQMDARSARIVELCWFTGLEIS